MAATKKVEHIGIRIETGETLFLPVRDTTNLWDLVMRFRRETKYGDVFLFNGIRIQKGDTPKKLNMQAEDVIEAYTRQDGGGFN